MKAILPLTVVGALVPPLMATGPDRGSIGEMVKPGKRYPTVYTEMATAPSRPWLSDLILCPPAALARWLVERYPSPLNELPIIHPTK